MKIILFVTFFVVFTNAFGQNVDSILIIQKAKLLTLSPYGLQEPDTMLSSIFRQHAKFERIGIDRRYAVITIAHHQDFKVKEVNGYRLKLCKRSDTCYYLCVFDYQENRFYRLKGYDANDFIRLYKSLNNSMNQMRIIFIKSVFEKPIIDVDCLYNKYILNKKGNCDDKCGECEPLVIH